MCVRDRDRERARERKREKEREREREREYTADSGRTKGNGAHQCDLDFYSPG